MSTKTDPPKQRDYTLVERARLQKNLTRQGLSNVTGVNVDTLMRIETRSTESRPTDRTLSRLAEFLGLNMWDIRADIERLTPAEPEATR